jgi:hypothetical protein
VHSNIKSPGSGTVLDLSQPFGLSSLLLQPCSLGFAYAPAGASKAVASVNANTIDFFVVFSDALVPK